ncbi:ricin-type beta-trefoil lectin domain protein [Actinophytocola oryzae]|uniref:Ricin-type beta-trefoil lectin protein n=1 Tax=Actinophytocola oryzae TaxID=502181 RepID=A0A4R7W5F1_9PSEU|nr:ricin-type beta-trefoil lectin domain protein [Actinophytocola oryzae]TDV57854.1 ricin-type beta-trefoil lectin protein [Actinophytocola oryzae]
MIVRRLLVTVLAVAGMTVAGQASAAPRVVPDPPGAFTDAPPAPSFGVTATICDGDGVSGKRVQAIYVRGDQQADRYGQFVGQFQTFADQIDQAFVEVAARTGGVRHVRFVTNAACRAVVDNVVIPQSSMSTVDTITAALKTRGYNRTDRKYLYWYENSGCGLAFGSGGDDRPGADNPYNAGPHYATLGTGCWSWQASAHELLHTLGAVQRSAPHSSAFGHCWDDEDIMCYDDGGLPNPPGGLVKVCPGAPENQIDCGNDDYFHLNPPAGSYLATHWNVANSQYLTGSSGGAGAITGVGGRCVDVQSSNTADGTPVQLWTCNSSGAQQWTVRGGTVSALGKCLDVSFSGTTNGTQIQLWTCNGTGAQTWQAQSNGSLRNPQSGRCLDATNGSSAEGTRLVIWDCNGGASQVWRLPAG